MLPASERAIVIYSVSDPSKWRELTEVSQLSSGRSFLRTQLNDEIYDLQWSPDSSCLILGTPPRGLLCATFLLTRQPAN